MLRRLGNEARARRVEVVLACAPPVVAEVLVVAGIGRVVRIE